MWRENFEDASFKRDGDVVGQSDAGHESAFLDGIDALAGDTHAGCQCVLGPVLLFSQYVNVVVHLNASSSRKYVIARPSGFMGISSLGTLLLKTKTKFAVYRSRLISL